MTAQSSATNASSTTTPPTVCAPAARVAMALCELQKIWPRGKNCEHTHAAKAFVELESLGSDLQALDGDASRVRVAVTALQAIANADDNFCHNNPSAALLMRDRARAGLGIPAAGPDRDPVKPACSQVPEPVMPTSFTASQFQTSLEQEVTVAAVKKFLAGGCKERDFTGPVYRCATGELGFIAHYDRRQFYDTYFRSWEGAETFVDGIRRAYNQRSWGSASHKEMKTAIFVLARTYGAQPGGAESRAPAKASVAAAAPDLLDELKTAVARTEIANAEGNPILSAWLPGARAVIAKAEAAAPATSSIGSAAYLPGATSPTAHGQVTP